MHYRALFMEAQLMFRLKPFSVCLVWWVFLAFFCSHNSTSFVHVPFCWWMGISMIRGHSGLRLCTALSFLDVDHLRNHECIGENHCSMIPRCSRGHLNWNHIMQTGVSFSDSQSIFSRLELYKRVIVLCCNICLVFPVYINQNKPDDTRKFLLWCKFHLILTFFLLGKKKNHKKQLTDGCSYSYTSNLTTKNK